MRYAQLAGVLATLFQLPAYADPLFTLDIEICAVEVPTTPEPEPDPEPGRPVKFQPVSALAPLASCRARSETIHQAYTTLDDLVSSLSNNGLQGMSQLYSQDSAATANLLLRGLPARAHYDEYSRTLVFSVPSLGISESFTGQTRNDSEKLLQEWFAREGRYALGRIHNEMARVSPIDPVAGTPGSLMGQMVAADFNSGNSEQPVPKDAATSNSGTFSSTGLEFDRYTSGGYQTNITRLPLRYSFKLDNGYSLALDAPLSRSDSEGALAYSASLGAALRMPINERWALTPALRYGRTKSEDLGAASQMSSVSLTSRYHWDLGEMRLGMANLLGQYQSAALKVGAYQSDYDLSNTLLRTGFDVSAPLQMSFLEQGSSWRAWIIDTRFFGDALYNENYQELGFAIGTPLNIGDNVIDNFTLGLSHTRGDNLRGTRLNFGYKF